ncbi:MAG: adenylate/guanylate cyclase domain-containing protein [Thermodesulfobacteriota bacterium]
MSRAQLFRLKNAMILANLVSNLVGVCVVLIVVRRSFLPTTPETWAIGNAVNSVFIPVAFLVPLVVTLLYERPIRRYLESLYRQEPPPEGLEAEVRRKLLNEPFFLIALDFAIWVAGAVIYPWVFRAHGVDVAIVRSTFFINLFTGLITTVVAFFVFEFVMQRRLVPTFFPQGGLFETPGTLRIRIAVRLTAMLLACNLVPFIALLGSVHYTSHVAQDPHALLSRIQTGLAVNAVIFMGVGVWVTFLVSSNLTRPLQEIIRVLQGVRNGRFDRRVRVTSNDEIGYAGDVINEMNQGLMERDFIKETFGKYVASEIRDEILAGRVPLDGELKEVTVLFADLRNFTPMVEANPPKEVVKIINGYFREMAEAIQNHHGLVLQFIGDEIEAVFGAPLVRPDHPVLAAQAALEMRGRLRGLNEELKGRGYRPLSHGVGIHTGEALAANIGSPERLSYALVGDTVNLASRLQGLTKELGTEIILSGATRAHLGERFSLVPLPPTRVKGKSHSVEIFSLDSDG